MKVSINHLHVILLNAFACAGIIGGWQTVSVVTVDEEKEMKEYEKNIEAIRNGEYEEVCN